MAEISPLPKGIEIGRAKLAAGREKLAKQFNLFTLDDGTNSDAASKLYLKPELSNKLHPYRDQRIPDSFTVPMFSGEPPKGIEGARLARLVKDARSGKMVPEAWSNTPGQAYAREAIDGVLIRQNGGKDEFYSIDNFSFEPTPEWEKMTAEHQLEKSLSDARAIEDHIDMDGFRSFEEAQADAHTRSQAKIKEIMARQPGNSKDQQSAKNMNNEGESVISGEPPQTISVNKDVPMPSKSSEPAPKPIGEIKDLGISENQVENIPSVVTTDVLNGEKVAPVIVTDNAKQIKEVAGNEEVPWQEIQKLCKDAIAKDNTAREKAHLPRIDYDHREELIQGDLKIEEQYYPEARQKVLEEKKKNQSKMTPAQEEKVIKKKAHDLAVEAAYAKYRLQSDEISRPILEDLLLQLKKYSCWEHIFITGEDPRVDSIYLMTSNGTLRIKTTNIDQGLEKVLEPMEETVFLPPKGPDRLLEVRKDYDIPETLPIKVDFELNPKIGYSTDEYVSEGFEKYINGQITWDEYQKRRIMISDDKKQITWQSARTGSHKGHSIGKILSEIPSVLMESKTPVIVPVKSPEPPIPVTPPPENRVKTIYPHSDLFQPEMPLYSEKFYALKDVIDKKKPTKVIGEAVADLFGTIPGFEINRGNLGSSASIQTDGSVHVIMLRKSGVDDGSVEADVDFAKNTITLTRSAKGQNVRLQLTFSPSGSSVNGRVQVLDDQEKELGGLRFAWNGSISSLKNIGLVDQSQTVDIAGLVHAFTTEENLTTPPNVVKMLTHKIPEPKV